MNRGRGKHLCRICEQNLQWLRVAVEPDSGILGLQAGEDVKWMEVASMLSVAVIPYAYAQGAMGPRGETT